MGRAIETRINNYLISKYELERKYKDLKNSSEVGDLLQDLKDLYEFDQLFYAYQAIKSYYQHSKSRQNSDARNNLDDFSLNAERTKLKLRIADLNQKIPGLAVLRRSLLENSQEGGKLAAKLVQSQLNFSELKINWTRASQPRSVEASPSSKTQSHSAPDSTTRHVSNGFAAHTHTNESTTENTESIKAQHKSTTNPQQSATQNADALEILEEATSNNESFSAAHDASLEPPHDKPSQEMHNIIATLPVTLIELSKEALLHAPKAVEMVSKLSGNGNGQSRVNDSLSTSNAAHIEELISGETSIKNKMTRRRELESGYFPRTKRPMEEGSFRSFDTWTRDHCRCIVKAAQSDQNNPVVAIQRAIEEEFGVTVTPQAAETLYRYYGLKFTDKNFYDSYNKAFKSIVDSNSEGGYNLAISWTQLRQLFKLMTGYNLFDWEAKERYYFYLLHRRVYGDVGEPRSNYADLIENYHRGVPIKRKSNENQGIETKMSLHDLSLLLSEALVYFPHETEQRSSAIMDYIYERSGEEMSLAVVEKAISLQNAYRNSMDQSSSKAAGDIFPSIQTTDAKVNPNVQRGDNEIRSNPQNLHASLLSIRDWLNKVKPTIIECEDSPEYYQGLLTEKDLTSTWTFDRSKCIMSTVKFLSEMKTATESPHTVSKELALKIITTRLAMDHKVKVSEKTLRDRLKVMMKKHLFQDNQMLMLQNFNL